MNDFEAKLVALGKESLCRLSLRVLQVNMGDLCNQSCCFCHVAAGPQGKKIMAAETVDAILRFLGYGKDLVLDITGGAPEMNPHFQYLVRSAGSLTKEILVRSNLTVLFEPELEGLFEFFARQKVHLVASLPCYLSENVDRLRGRGVFEKSLKALKMLNAEGYGSDPALKLDLVYNPAGLFLPPPQGQLEADYKTGLRKEHGIVFNRLMTITNAPIRRFRDYLEREGGLLSYSRLLQDRFNEKVVDDVMCRSLLSVGWDGHLYDCDFNQAEGLSLLDELGQVLSIGSVHPDDFVGRRIHFADHCFCCTAGVGSSCQGALAR